MANAIRLNPGAQKDFVLNDFRHSAYIGGVGAGKTFALCARGLKYAQQPKAPGEKPPVGCLLTISYPALKDIVYPALYKVFELAGMPVGHGANNVKESKQHRTFTLPTGGTILMRSLDEPDRIRGIEVAWFGIDEGRNFKDDYAYTIMVGRLRQGKDVYNHAGWVCSTPNGYDWMWRRFHPESDKRLASAQWFNAPTYDNEGHLPEEYLRDLEREYEGKFFEQEVLGHFVGAIGGGVFPNFDRDKHAHEPLRFRADLPLYSFWDFGIGDAGVCIFAQVEWVPKNVGAVTEHVPMLRVIGYIEMKDATIAEWANAFYAWLEKNLPLDEQGNMRVPVMSFGDPAGMQRNMVTGTSVYDALYRHGIVVSPAPKRPKDEAIIILQNLIEGGRLRIDSSQDRLIQAVSQYHWKLDGNGERVGNLPIHDWSSHFCDALQYGAAGLIGLHPRRVVRPSEPARRGTMGFIEEQLLRRDNAVVMNMPERPGEVDWHPDQPVREEEWV